MEWQPIKTAPKDGTRVILFRPDWIESMVTGYWNKDFDDWFIPYNGSPFLSPTHWMPLPEAPK